MATHASFTVATGVPVYFCDPHSPWQRGSNENTNGLLRQYMPSTPIYRLTRRGTWHESNGVSTVDRARTLGYMTPLEKFAEFVALTA